MLLYLSRYDVGNVAWEDSSRATARIMWKTPASVTTKVYNWACQNDYLHTTSIFTVFELNSGDEHLDSGFHGTDPFLFHKSMKLLQSEGKLFFGWYLLYMHAYSTYSSQYLHVQYLSFATDFLPPKENV